LKNGSAPAPITNAIVSFFEPALELEPETSATEPDAVLVLLAPYADAPKTVAAKAARHSAARIVIRITISSFLVARALNPCGYLVRRRTHPALTGAQQVIAQALATSIWRAR